MWIELCVYSVLVCLLYYFLVWKKKPTIPNVIYTFWHDPARSIRITADDPSMHGKLAETES